MLEFLLALLTTATVGVLLVPLLRTSARRTERLDSALASYRDQLAEIERARTRLLNDVEMLLADSRALALTLSETIAMGDWRKL